MYKYLRIFTILSAVLLMGAGCNSTKVEKTVEDNVGASADNQVKISYTVDKKEETKQANEIINKDDKETAPTVVIKTEVIKNQQVEVKEELVKTSSKTVEVNISEFAFAPTVIKIKIGDTVKWTNNDEAPHKVASNPHPSHTDLPGLVSEGLFKGESYSFTFNKAGTFGYHCHFHPAMIGTVIVE